MTGHATYTTVSTMAVWNSSYKELIGMKCFNNSVSIECWEKLKEIINNLISEMSAYKIRLPKIQTYMDEQTNVIKN